MKLRTSSNTEQLIYKNNDIPPTPQEIKKISQKFKQLVTQHSFLGSNSIEKKNDNIYFT